MPGLNPGARRHHRRRARRRGRGAPPRRGARDRRIALRDSRRTAARGGARRADDRRPGRSAGALGRRLRERCHVEQPHSSHVQRLALILFDALGDAPRLHAARIATRSPTRRCCTTPAITSATSGTTSIRTISFSTPICSACRRRSRWSWRTSRAITAASQPKKTHANYGALDSTLRRRIKRLSAILRVADGFDRGHVERRRRREDCAGRSARSGSRRCRRRSERAMRLEMWGANRKSDLLAESRGRAGRDRRARRAGVLVRRHRRRARSSSPVAGSRRPRSGRRSAARQRSSLSSPSAAIAPPHEFLTSRSCERARRRPARAEPSAVGVEVPRLSVVLEIRREQRAQPLVQRRTLPPAPRPRRGGRSCAASSRPSRGRTPRRHRSRNARGASARGSGRRC